MIGRSILAHPVRTLLFAALFLAGAAALLVRGGTLTTGSIDGLESARASALVARVLGHPADTTFTVVFSGRELSPENPLFRKAEEEALAPLRTDPRVLSVEATGDPGPSAALALTNSERREAVAFVTLRGDVRQALSAYEGVRVKLRSPRLSITCTGLVPFTHDLDATLSQDLLRAEVVSLPLSVLVLLWVFRTVAAAVLPVAVGALAVLGGIAVVLALSHHMDMAAYAVNVCSLVGLGVAIDYSLFTVSRYREELAAGYDYQEALVRAMRASGRMVAFSGLAALSGLGGLFFFEGSYLFSMGLGAAIVVTLAVVFALTVLPALLALLGPRIHAGRLPGTPPQADRGASAFRRIATLVMRRPVLVLLPTLSLLVGLGVPFRRLRVAAADVTVLAPDVEARRGYDALRAGFPALSATRLVVAVEFPAAPTLTEARIAALHALSRRVRELPDVLAVESPFDAEGPDPGSEYFASLLLHPPAPQAAEIAAATRMSAGERVAWLGVVTPAAQDSERARELVRRIRAVRSVADGTLVVGGQPAEDLDTASYVMERVPRAIGFVVAITLVTLFLLLGSVVLPLKAVVMNFVSIMGSFGALVWIFQDGHLFVQEPRPIEPSVPVVLFCALFGLSMDYEVLMLSRMKELHEQGADNTQAVAEGLTKTAGLITSAAVIMVVVFSAFAMAAVVVLRAVGVGMALAVAIDATLVRVLLVPSTMRLFGDLNWWAPEPLTALRRRLGLGGH